MDHNVYTFTEPLDLSACRHRHCHATTTAIEKGTRGRGASSRAPSSSCHHHTVAPHCLCCTPWTHRWSVAGTRDEEEEGRQRWEEVAMTSTSFVLLEESGIRAGERWRGEPSRGPCPLELGNDEKKRRRTAGARQRREDEEANRWSSVVAAISSCGCDRPSPASLAARGRDASVCHERKKEGGGELEGVQGYGGGESAWVKWGRLGWGKKAGHFTFSPAPDSS
jgi:hypothetical protein